MIEKSDLPASLKMAAQRFVKHASRRNRRRSAVAEAMIGHFSKQIALGVPSEALLAQWNDVIPLPTYLQLNDPSLLVIHSLPVPVSELIANVISKTQLWRREKIDVARELIAHFEDGLDAGLNPEQLTKEFGSSETASQLIRRAKLRNRPLAWHAARRLVQATAIGIAFLMMWALYLLVRFEYAKPHIAFDYVGEIDARSKAIAESDRAWPFYAKALTRMKWNLFASGRSFTPVLTADGQLPEEWQGLLQPMDVKRIDGRIVQTWPVNATSSGAPPDATDVQREYQINSTEFLTALNELSHGKHWAALVQYADMNNEATQLVLQGAAKSQFGFIFRDSDNAKWLAALNESAYESFEKASRSALMGVLLPHLQNTRSLHFLLDIEIERARVAGNHDRVTELLVAKLKIAAQIYHADGFTISRLIGTSFAKSSWNSIRQILDEQPDFFSDANLRILAHGIAAFRMEVDLDFPLDLKPMFDDLLQRLYSDDGQMNGHLTADGWRLMNPQINPQTGRSNLSSSLAPFQLEGAMMSGMIASRAEMKQVFDRYTEIELQATRRPLWESRSDSSPSGAEYLKSLLSNPMSRMKYRPLVALEPMLGLSTLPEIAHSFGEFHKMYCDSTLVAIGLTMYHRRHGAWPENLGQLTPDLLPTVPPDRFDGQTLKFRLIDGKPTVYSVGKNRKDDGGTWDNETQPGYELEQGDWRLWPARKPD